MPFTAFTSGLSNTKLGWFTLNTGVNSKQLSGQYTSTTGGALSGDKSFTFAGRRRHRPDASLFLFSRRVRVRNRIRNQIPE